MSDFDNQLKERVTKLTSDLAKYVAIEDQRCRQIADLQDALAARTAELEKERREAEALRIKYVAALRDCLPERAHMIDIGVHRPANFKVADLTVGQLRGIYAALRRIEGRE